MVPTAAFGLTGCSEGNKAYDVAAARTAEIFGHVNDGTYEPQMPRTIHETFGGLNNGQKVTLYPDGEIIKDTAESRQITVGQTVVEIVHGETGRNTRETRALNMCAVRIAHLGGAALVGAEELKGNALLYAQATGLRAKPVDADNAWQRLEASCADALAADVDADPTKPVVFPKAG